MTTTTTRDTFRTASPDERVRLVEHLLETSLRALRPGQPAWFDGTTRLASLAIDSIQLVELKFALEELVGMELDVNVFIVNPTVHELAMSVAAAAQ
jgi:hypothetical protein